MRSVEERMSLTDFERMSWSYFDINYHMSNNHRYKTYKDVLIIEESYPSENKFMYHIVKNNDKKMTIKIDSSYIFGIYCEDEHFKFAIPYNKNKWFLIDIDTFDFKSVASHNIVKLEERWYYEDFDVF